MEFHKTLQEYGERVEAAINALTPPASTRPDHLHQAMRYSLEAGGKRLRPILVLTGHDLFPSDLDPLPAAVAVECLHTYSLIHDDLPCMDDSDLRRGLPTCHKKFDEATALLAGDALLTYPFWLISHHYRSRPAVAVDLIEELSRAAGSEHLIGGQMEDLIGERSEFSPERLDFIHLNKTAALITSSLVMGARLGKADDKVITAVRSIGNDLGLAFQIVDDILDSTSDSKTLGKTAGIDEVNGKLTYTAFYGLEKSRQQARKLTRNAAEKTHSIGGNSTFLLELIHHLEHRIK